MQNRLAAAINAVQRLDTTLAERGQTHLDNLTKPKNSLGRLEELALRLYMIQEGRAPEASPACIYAVAGDHGVVAEGVSVSDQDITRQMVLNFMNGGAGINVLCDSCGVDLKLVDAGSCGGAYPEHPTLTQCKIRPGTANMAQGPAMSEDDCLKALCLGLDLADEAKAQGYRAIGTGEMGVGNTTPSTALYCAYLGLDPAEMTGPGAGLPPKAIARKAQVVRRALDANRAAIASGDALQILAAVGGLELATLAGLIIGAARNRLAVAVDGFISTAAYIAAYKLCPAVEDYCFISHASGEPGHIKAVQALHQRPLLDLDMRLGEGTGAALGLFLLRCSADIFNKMATFADAAVTDCYN